MFLPFYLEFNGSINFIYLLFNGTFAGFFKILFGFCLLYFYGFKIGFLEKAIVKIIQIINYISFPNAQINIPRFNILMYIIYFLIVILLFYFREINFKNIYKKLSFIYISFIALYAIPLHNYFTFEISFLNVGQGDCTFIHYKNKNFLVDTGGLINYDLANNSIIPFLKSKRIYYLDSVFITHYDYDHYGALEGLKENFKIRNIYDYNNFMNVSYNNFIITNLNNYRSHDSDENDKSLVLHVVINDFSVLLMGDASKVIEEKIIRDYKIDCDILKLGHHGSKTSNSESFIKAVHPELGIISCGANNKFNHPNIEVINILNKLNISYKRTDELGTISYKFTII